jgi:hypothetical protein
VKPVPEAALGAVRETLREHGEPIAAGAMTFMQGPRRNSRSVSTHRRSPPPDILSLPRPKQLDPWGS